MKRTIIIYNDKNPPTPGECMDAHLVAKKKDDGMFYVVKNRTGKRPQEPITPSELGDLLRGLVDRSPELREACTCLCGIEFESMQDLRLHEDSCRAVSKVRREYQEAMMSATEQDFKIPT